MRFVSYLSGAYAGVYFKYLPLLGVFFPPFASWEMFISIVRRLKLFYIFLHCVPYLFIVFCWIFGFLNSVAFAGACLCFVLSSFLLFPASILSFRSLFFIFRFCFILCFATSVYFVHSGFEFISSYFIYLSLVFFLLPHLLFFAGIFTN